MIKTNITYGLIVLIPVAIIVLLLAKIVEVLEQIARPLGLQSLLGTAVAIALGILLLLALCFVIGALLRSRRTGISFERIESALLSKVPGYEVFGNVLKGFAADKLSFPPALVNLSGPDAAVFALIMDENEDGTLTVFVPASPALTVGVVHVVKPNLVTRLEASVADVTGCVSQWGIGSRKVLAESASGKQATPAGAVDRPASTG
jgi:uncharacterized membrane protein